VLKILIFRRGAGQDKRLRVRDSRCFPSPRILQAGSAAAHGSEREDFRITHKINRVSQRMKHKTIERKLSLTINDKVYTDWWFSGIRDYFEEDVYEKIREEVHKELSEMVYHNFWQVQHSKLRYSYLEKLSEIIGQPEN